MTFTPYLPYPLLDPNVIYIPLVKEEYKCGKLSFQDFGTIYLPIKKQYNRCDWSLKDFYSLFITIILLSIWHCSQMWAGAQRMLCPSFYLYAAAFISSSCSPTMVYKGQALGLGLISGLLYIYMCGFGLSTQSLKDLQDGCEKSERNHLHHVIVLTQILLTS